MPRLTKTLRINQKEKPKQKFAIKKDVNRQFIIDIKETVPTRWPKRNCLFFRSTIIGFCLKMSNLKSIYFYIISKSKVIKFNNTCRKTQKIFSENNNTIFVSVLLVIREWDSLTWLYSFVFIIFVFRLFFVCSVVIYLFYCYYDYVTILSQLFIYLYGI